MFRSLLLFCSLALVLGFSSCRKAVFDNLEDRLEGTWMFEDAQHRARPGTFESVYQYYQGDYVTFYKDNNKRVVYEEANGDRLEGVWDLHVVDNGDGVQYILSIALKDVFGNLVQYVWETEGLIGRNRMRVNGGTSDYDFCYDLRRD